MPANVHTHVSTELFELQRKTFRNLELDLDLKERKKACLLCLGGNVCQEHMTPSGHQSMLNEFEEYANYFDGGTSDSMGADTLGYVNAAGEERVSV
jgi:hypothetical protein